MTRDAVLKRLADLVARRSSMSRMAGNRGRWTSWALTGESLFVRVFDSSDPLLVSFRAAARGVADKNKDWITSVHVVTGAFDACKAELENAPPGAIEARLAASRGKAKLGDQPAQAGEAAIRLFISHASTDARLAGLVVSLLRSALNLPAAAIRCTSMDGYRLPGGADTDEQIRREVLDAEAMIGIISVASLDSLYVAFELGARWGADWHLIPLMAPGVPPSAIKGPLGGKNALQADNASQLHQLVDELGGQLGIKPHGAAAYQSDVEAILSLAKTASAPTTAPRAHLEVVRLPDGFRLYEGMVWDMRSGAAVPYCEGCRTGSRQLVAMSCVELGPSPLSQIRTYTCPHGHPKIVFGPGKSPPLTPLQMETISGLKGPKEPGTAWAMNPQLVSFFDGIKSEADLRRLVQEKREEDLYLEFKDQVDRE